MSVQLLRSPPQSSSHAVTAIPQELLDSVIDHLKDDKASLRACSLSQRAWLNRSWKHLHYHVSIDMLRRVRDPSRYSYGHSPEYVDSLELLHLGHSVAAPSAVPLATRLSHVRNLTISFGAWDKLDAAQKREFLALYPNVEMLKIKGVSYTNCNDFLDFLSAFPHLSHLTLMFVYFSASSDAPCHEPTPNFDPNLPLRSLRVLDCSNEVVDALAVVLSQTQKQMSNEFSMSLEWAISRAASYAINNTTQHVFSRVGRFPTKLSLDFKAVPVSEITGLEHCDRLQSLDIVLDLFTVHDGIRHSEHYSWLPSLLEEISSGHLNEISFTFKNAHLWRSPVGMTIFGNIDKTLTTGRFGKLKQVEIYLKSPRENKMQILEYFVTYLPELVSRGLLMYDIVD